VNIAVAHRTAGAALQSVYLHLAIFDNSIQTASERGPIFDYKVNVCDQHDAGLAGFALRLGENLSTA
jgi:hypothetical protein